VLAGLPLPALWQVACLATLGGDPLQDIVLELEADLILRDDLAVGEALSQAEQLCSSQPASHPNAYKKIAYTYPPLLLRVLVRIPRVLGLRLELLVQTPLESPLAAAIEALLAPLLGVHAAGVGRQPIEAIRSVSAQYLLAIGARRRGPVAWVQSRMPGCLSMRLSPDFGWVIHST